MEPKKNPKKDLNKDRGLYFLAGLALVLLMTYCALEWKTYSDNHDYDVAMNVADELIEEVPIIVPLKTPPPPVAPPAIEIEENDADIEETVIESTETNQEEPVYEVEEITVMEEDELDEVPFMVIEDVPYFSWM